MTLLAALFLAGQPAPAALAIVAGEPTLGIADAELVNLFARVCEGRSEPGAEFQAIPKRDLPAELRTMNLADRDGSFLRRGGSRPAFVVLTQGPGHWTGIEEICSVAVQGAEFDSIVAAFAARLPEHSTMRLEQWGTVSVSYFSSSRGSVGITQMPSGWVSLSCGGIINTVAPVCQLVSKGTE